MIKLAVTAGDPAGIGPEIVEKALQAFSDATVVVLPTGPPCPGRPSAETGRAALCAVDRAVESALRGEVAGIVNAPLSKAHVLEAGIPFFGHTEYLAAKSGVKHPTMLHVSDPLRVALVTTHLPIRKVAAALSVDRIRITIRQAAQGLQKYFDVPDPRIAVAGLNPHAGEDGKLGREEIDVIAPAIELAREEGLRVSGPLGGDTVFARAVKGEFDLVVAMYHDQALAPLKMIAFDAVNVTLGLPFVRTSVDHGTGFDIAGKGIADPRPFLQALRVAASMARKNAALL